MPKQEESSLNLVTNNWPALVAIVVAFVGLAVIRPQLESPRPTPAAPDLPHSRWDNTVQARLWQDPLAGFVGDTQIKRLMDMPLCKVIEDMRQMDYAGKDLIKAPEKNEVLFIFVFVDGRSGAAAAEQRRRERFAALSALNTAGYAPLRSERLSYVRSTFPDKQENSVKLASTTKEQPTTDGRTEKEIVIPYEWVRPYKSVKYSAVCLMWIKDSLVAKYKPSFFRTLQKNLREGIRLSASASFCEDAEKGNSRARSTGPENRTSNQPGASFAIAGGINSNHLAYFKREFEDARLAEIPIYITKSTALVVRRDICAQCGSQLHFLIGTDDALAERLVEELGNRRLTLDEPKNHIAIVAEWDTDYGRDMCGTFKKAIEDAIERDNPNVDVDQVHQKVDKLVCCYSYLAGLDGKLPGETKPADGGEAKSEGTVTTRAAAADLPGADKGEGDSQIDYLRRLVERMKSEHRTFRAIGVLGGDVYDKLLILKALRPSFPEAVFFTTDLDARLVQPAELPSTRNLLIASHYGLTLKTELQDRIPPFRSSYDTASYLGYLKLVHFGGVEEVLVSQTIRRPGRPERIYPSACWKKRDGNTEEIPPRLFEVARNDAYELTFDANDHLLYGPTPRQQMWLLENYRLVYLALSLLVLGSLLCLFSKPWCAFLAYPFQGLKPYLFPTAAQHGDNETQQIEDSKSHGHISLAVWIGLVLALVLAWLMYYAHRHVDEEPVLWFSGLSVWPSITLRLLACVLAFSFVLHVVDRLRSRNTEIENEIGPAPENGTLVREKQEPRPFGERTIASVQKAMGMGMWAWKPEGDIYTVWAKLREHGTNRRRILGSLFLSLVYGLLIALFYMLFDWPTFPTRGRVTWWVFIILFAVSEASLIFLLVFIVDCTFLCYRFVTYLESAAEKKWPNPALKRLAVEKGLNDQAPEQREALKQCLLIRLVDLATKEVAKFLYAPFTVILLLVIAQSSLFENWQWNIPILLTTLVNAAVALCCAWMLQRTAKHAKDNAVAALDKLIVPRIGDTKDGVYAKLRRMREHIAGLHSGAFGGFLQNPAIKAALIPLGGGGGLAALEGLLTYLHM